MTVYIEGPDPGISFLVDLFTMTEIAIDDSWKVAAQARIDIIRKGTLNIDITSSSDLNGVTVQVRQ